MTEENDAVTNDPAFPVLRDYMHDRIRLQKLSNEDLIRECMKDDLADDPRVVELMNRVRPGWQKELL